LDADQQATWLQILRAVDRRKRMAPGTSMRERAYAKRSAIQKELDWFNDRNHEYFEIPFKDWDVDTWVTASAEAMKSQRVAKKNKEIVDLEAEPAAPTPIQQVQPAPDSNSVLQQILQEIQNMKQDIAELKKQRAPPSESEPEFSYNFTDHTPILPSPPQEEQVQPLRQKRKPSNSEESSEGHAASANEPADEKKEGKRGKTETDPLIVSNGWDFFAKHRKSTSSLDKMGRAFASVYPSEDATALSRSMKQIWLGNTAFNNPRNTWRNAWHKPKILY
jgi:hypothetical protein